MSGPKYSPFGSFQLRSGGWQCFKLRLITKQNNTLIDVTDQREPSKGKSYSVFGNPETLVSHKKYTFVADNHYFESTGSQFGSETMQTLEESHMNKDCSCSDNLNLQIYKPTKLY